MTSPTPNQIAVEAIAQCHPVLTGLVVARDALGLADGELGHAGPPFESREQLPPVMLNAFAGAAVHEGWAGDMATGREMVLEGAIRLRCNHDLGVVSPMTGVVRPGQVLMRLADRSRPGRRVHATLAEKGRNVLRFGFYDRTVGESLRDLEGRIAEAIAEALPRDGLPILPISAKGIELGDDGHQRNVGAMLAFLAALPALDATVATWLSDHPQHFLNYLMAAQKMCLDAADGIAGSSIVTAISRNGVDCAIRVSGTGSQWFRSPATLPEGGYFDGWSRDDAQADIGDSAITEAYGLGGCVAHCSPELARAMRRDWAEASREGARMVQLFEGRNPQVTPALAGDGGVGLGLDARRVVEAGADVRIHTGIAHAAGTGGWIGIGVAKAPLACFAASLNALDRERP